MNRKFSITFYLFYAILLLLPIVCFSIFDISPVFYNNDDLFLKQIASGELTGRPESHLLHIGYLTGALLRGLYSIFPSVSWYGVFLFSCTYICIILLLHALLRQTFSKIARAALITGVFLITYAFLAMHLLQIQYTTVTAIICSASLACFYLSEEHSNPGIYLRRNITCLVLFFISFSIRDKACIMFLPAFFFIGICICFKNRQMLRSVAAFAGSLLGIILLCTCIERIAYSEPALQDFEQYNTCREQIVDYDGYPNYEEYKDTYEALGISYESYVSASTRYQLLLDENINVEFMTELAKLSPQDSPRLFDMLRSFIDRHLFSYQDRPLNLVVYVLYLFAFLLIFANKKYRLLLDMSAILAGRMVIWGYLIYVDRAIPRVTQGVYVAELFLLLSFCCKNQLWTSDSSQKARSPKILTALCCICILFTAVKWGHPNTQYIIRYNDSQLQFSVAYREIREYFYTNKDNVYLLDTNSFSYFTENIFQSTPPSQNNFVLMGSWTANSPWTDSIAAAHGISSYENAAVTQDNVFFVFLHTDGTDHTYMNNYLNSKYPGATLELYDTFLTSNGLEFQILQVQQ